MQSLFWTLTSCWNLNFGASIYGVLIVDQYGGRLFCLLALSILTSAVGCAAFISMNDKPVLHKNWDSIEMKQSSTWRELMCVKHALRGFTHFLKEQCAKWYTDNKGVETIVKSGSNKVHLHKLAMEIFSLSKEHDIAIDMVWIPRSDNEVADYVSKIVNFDDWGV